MKSGFARRHHSWFAQGLRLLDAFTPVGLLYVLMAVYAVPWSRPYMVAAILGAVLTMVMMQAVDAYRPWRGAKLWTEARVLVGGWLLVAGSLLLIAWGTKSTAYFSRVVIGAWFIAAPLAMVGIHLGGRLFLRWLRRHGRNTRTAVIVGAGELGQELASRIEAAEWTGVRILGFFDDAAAKQGSNINHMPVLGMADDAVAYIKNNNVDLVYFALPMRAEARMRMLFEGLQDTTASIYMVPDLFVFELLGARLQDIDGLPVFALCQTPFFGPFGLVKRAEDVVLASLILLFVSPLMLLIAVCIKLTSPGPVLFKQKRYGLDGREIKVYKFRTMTVCEDGEHVEQAKKDDPRVTSLGCFLRRTSLDELPQFINVLQGRMSVVRPRPHAVAHNEQYRKVIQGYMWRHKVRPGITGWAQVNGWRGDTDIKKRIDYDIYYIEHWSLLFDLKIVWLTLWKGFVRRNAY